MEGVKSLWRFLPDPEADERRQKALQQAHFATRRNFIPTKM